jgi:hypothetical protein
VAKREQSSRLRRPTSKLAATPADPTQAVYPSGQAPVMPTGDQRRRRRLHPNSTAATVWKSDGWTFRT